MMYFEGPDPNVQVQPAVGQTFAFAAGRDGEVHFPFQIELEVRTPATGV
jgi:hypothetical protein